MKITVILEHLIVTATDATFVTGVLNGDIEAFAELYNRRARVIRAICYDATGDLHAAEDLTQEVFLRAYCKLRDLRDPGKFSPWLAGIARHVCREWRRHRLRELKGIERLDKSEASEPFPQLDERIASLRKAIASLPEKERWAMHAFYLEEQNVKQARQWLGLSRSGFYDLLCRARQRLQGLLEREEVRP